MTNLELAAAFGAADGAKEQDLRGYYPMAARVLAEEVRRRKAGHDALKEVALKTGELIEHLQKTGRLAPCFKLPALDAARGYLGALRATERWTRPWRPSGVERLTS